MQGLRECCQDQLWGKGASRTEQRKQLLGSDSPQGALKLDGSLGLLPELRGQAFVSLHGPVTTLGKVAPSQGQFLERLAAEICQPTYYHPSGWGIVPEAWRGTRQHTSICNNDPGAAAVLFNLESSTFRTPVGVLSAGNF